MKSKSGNTSTLLVLLVLIVIVLLAVLWQGRVAEVREEIVKEPYRLELTEEIEEPVDPLNTTQTLERAMNDNSDRLEQFKTRNAQ